MFGFGSLLCLYSEDTRLGVGASCRRAVLRSVTPVDPPVDAAWLWKKSHEWLYERKVPPLAAELLFLSPPFFRAHSLENSECSRCVRRNI